jgi:hypothetical protein
VAIPGASIPSSLETTIFIYSHCLSPRSHRPVVDWASRAGISLQIPGLTVKLPLTCRSCAAHLPASDCANPDVGDEFPSIK